MNREAFSPRLILLGRGLAFGLLALVPLVVHQEYYLHILSLAFVFGVAALGMQLLLGYAGLLSIGQAAFLGIGAYTSALLTKAGWPFVLAFVASGVLSGILSLVLVPITRLRGIYLAVATLGFTIIVHLIFTNEEWLTGGTLGIMNITALNVGTSKVAGELTLYYTCLLVLLAVFLAFHRIVDSRFGRALQAIMLDEDAARASGVNVTMLKSQCFVLAALVTGFAGSLYAHHAQYLNPNDFTFWKSIEILIMVSVGGIGSLAGAIVGAFVGVILPEALRAIDQWRMVIYGALLVVFMGFGARGLAGLFAALVRRMLPSPVAAPNLERASVRS